MKMDLTIKITPKMVTDAQGKEKKALVGHLGTHFDVMNKEIPLEYAERKGVVFDVSGIKDRDIDCADHGVFIVENLCSLHRILENGENFLAHTYPMNYAEMTGLPCRVIAEI